MLPRTHLNLKPLWPDEFLVMIQKPVTSKTSKHDVLNSDPFRSVQTYWYHRSLGKPVCLLSSAWNCKTIKAVSPTRKALKNWVGHSHCGDCDSKRCGPHLLIIWPIFLVMSSCHCQECLCYTNSLPVTIFSLDIISCLLIRIYLKCFLV